MKKMNAKDIAIPAIALFIICLVASVLLALTNSVTAEKIIANGEKAVQDSLALVVEADSFSEEKAAGDLAYYEAMDKDGNVIAYVFTSSAKGYGGDVKVMTAYDLEGVITGFTVVDCANETPGLGQNAKTHFTSDFFNGKSGELKVAKDGGDVQAITAATITSRAVAAAVSASNEAVMQLINGEGSSDAVIGGADEATSIKVEKGGEK